MTRDQELLVMTGNAHPALAQAIAGELEIDLVDAVVDQFPDGETHVEINDDVREEDIFVIQPTGPPANHNFMEGLVMIDALRRASAGRITAVVPYYGYGRQDRKERSRVPITAKLVTDLFVEAGADRLLAIDLHAHQIQGFTNIPFDHLYAAKTMAEALRTETNPPVVVAPDVGAAKMIRGFARRLKTQYAIVDKERTDPETTITGEVIGASVENRNALIVDDMTSTGGSLMSAAKSLKERGALRVSAAVTHGVFSGDAIKRIEDNPYLDHLYTTDTLPEVLPSPKISRITIAPLLAHAILNIHRGESVTTLF